MAAEEKEMASFETKMTRFKMDETRLSHGAAQKMD
jgi:hypothetical protein